MYKTPTLIIIATLSASATDITLVEAVKNTLEKNPNLQISALAPKISKTDILKESGIFDIWLNGSFLHTNSKAAMSTAFQTDVSTLALSKYTDFGSNIALNYTKNTNAYSPSSSVAPYSATAGVSISQNLLKNFGATVNNTKLYVASKAYESAKYGFYKDTMDAIYEAQVSYWNLYEAQKGYKLDGYGLSIVDELLRRKERMVELGGFPKALLQEIAASKADMQTTLANSYRGLKLAQIAFGTTLGMGGHEFEVKEPPFQHSIKTENAINEAYKNRPELLANWAQKEALQRMDGYYNNQLMPTLTLNANFGSNNPNAQSESYYPLSKNHNTHSAGINLSIPIDNSSANADAQKAKLNLMLIAAQENKIKQDIEYQVKKAVVELERISVVLNAAKKSVEAQEEVIKNEDRKLELGLTTMKNYLDNQHSLVARKKALSAYECAMMRAVAEYYKAIGTPPEYLNITLSEQK